MENLQEKNQNRNAFSLNGILGLIIILALLAGFVFAINLQLI